MQAPNTLLCVDGSAHTQGSAFSAAHTQQGAQYADNGDCTASATGYDGGVQANGVNGQFAGGSLLNAADYTQFRPQSTELYLAQMIQRSRLELPKPGIFSGDVLQFTPWARSFHTLIVQTGLPNTELYHYLKTYLGGEALNLIKDLEIQDHPDLYVEAVKKLRRRYGDPVVVANAYMTKLHGLQHIGGNNAQQMQEFCNALDAANMAKSQYSTLNILDYPSELNNIVCKLPQSMIQRWNRAVNERYRVHGLMPTFDELCTFVNKEKDILTNPLTCQINVKPPQSRKHSNVSANGTAAHHLNGSSVKKSTSFGTTTAPDKHSSEGKSKGGGRGQGGGSQGGGQQEGGGANGGRAPKCLYCSAEHWLDVCPKIQKLSMSERHQYIKKKFICFICLRKGHTAERCVSSRPKCQICKRHHATILQRGAKAKATANATQSSEDDASQSATAADSAAAGSTASADTASAASANTRATECTAVSKVTGASHDAVAMQSRAASAEKSAMIVPVWLFKQDDPAKRVLVYAALDTQSDSTFLLQSAADKIEASGKEISLSLSTMSGANQIIKASKVSDLAVEAFGGGDVVQLPSVYTRSIMPCETAHIATSDKVRAWPHLKFLTSVLEKSPLDADIALLIGYDCPKALMPTEIVAPPAGDASPYAVKTALGWSVVGPLDHSSLDLSDCHLSMTYPVQSLQTGETMHHSAIVYRTAVKETFSPKQVLRMFDQDFNLDKPSIQEMSQEDLQFVAKMEEKVSVDAHRYVAPLPFKSMEEPDLPNNRSQAAARLSKIRSKML